MHQCNGSGLHEEIGMKSLIAKYYYMTASKMQHSKDALVGRHLTNSLLFSPATLAQPLWALPLPLHLPNREPPKI